MGTFDVILQGIDWDAIPPHDRQWIYLFVAVEAAMILGVTSEEIQQRMQALPITLKRGVARTEAEELKAGVDEAAQGHAVVEIRPSNPDGGDAAQ